MRIIAALLSLFALPLCAALEIDPPSGDTRTSFAIVVDGVSGGGGAPTLQGVEVSGRTIEIHMKLSGGGISAPIAWYVTAHAGPLPAGVYDGVVDYSGYRGETATLIVRDAVLSAFPHVLPIGGGAVRIYADGSDFIQQISVDGGRGIDIDQGAFFVPPHAAGTVDVTALTVSGKIVKASALLTFDDGTGPPDPALWEPILFPIAVSGGGAFGAQWCTTNTIRYGSSFGSATFRASLECNGCGAFLGPLSFPAVLPPGGAAGRVVYVGRGEAANLWLTSRVWETTHGALTIVPVFRERDLRHVATILDIPHPPVGMRATLRIRSFSPQPDLALNIFVDGGLVKTVTPTPQPDAPFFAAVNLSAALLARDGNAAPIAVQVRAAGQDPYLARIWALLSITDNVTQQTLVFAPQ